MQKVGSTTDTADANGEWTNGNVAQGVSPTVINAAILNTHQRELVNIVESAGMQLDPNDDGQVLKAINKTVSGGRLLNVQKFTISGVYTPTPGTKSVVVEAIGGGGAGGGCPATGVGQISYGNGGTSGSYGKGRFTSAFSGVSITIGAGGAGVSGATGSTGGTTSFGTLLVCPGGFGGGARGPISPPVGLGGAASSGSPAAGANILSVAGSPGEAGFAASDVVIVSGLGGHSFFGGPAARNTVGLAPATAYNFGAGGTGSFTTQSLPSAAGGGGGPGLIVIWEFA